MKIKPNKKPGAVLKDLSNKESKDSADVYYTMEEHLPKFGWLPVPLHGNDEYAVQKAIAHRRSNSHWIDKVRVCRMTREVVTILTSDQPKKVGFKIKLRKK